MLVGPMSLQRMYDAKARHQPTRSGDVRYGSDRSSLLVPGTRGSGRERARGRKKAPERERLRPSLRLEPRSRSGPETLCADRYAAAWGITTLPTG
jgi:hypothetical protein